jgi:hypothetical protein
MLQDVGGIHYVQRRHLPRKVFLVSSAGWPSTHSQLKFDNQQLYRETARLELRYNNNITFTGNWAKGTEKPAEQFVRFITKVAPSKMQWLTGVTLREKPMHFQTDLGPINAFNRIRPFCTQPPSWRVADDLKSFRGHADQAPTMFSSIGLPLIENRLAIYLQVWTNGNQLQMPLNNFRVMLCPDAFSEFICGIENSWMLGHFVGREHGKILQLSRQGPSSRHRVQSHLDRSKTGGWLAPRIYPTLIQGKLRHFA